MRRLTKVSIRDILAATAIVAAHFGIVGIVLSSSGSYLPILLLGMPIALTALVHWRYQLNWQYAALVHYPIAIAWAFCFSLMLPAEWNRREHGPYDIETIGLSQPVRFAFENALMMSPFAFLTMGFYFTVCYNLFPVRNRTNDG